jgi:hypothetical protein
MFEIKPILEISQEIEQIQEENNKGEKNYYLKGIYSECDVKNGNGRTYPFSIMEREINKLNKKVDNGVAFGEFGHPKSMSEMSEITPARVTHRVVEIKTNGNNFEGKSVIIPEGLGKIAIAMIETGGILSVSSRGVGSINKNTGIVESNYSMYTYDLVFNPGMKKANQTAILENKELLVNEIGVFTEKEWFNIEQNRKELDAILFKHDLFNVISKLKKL